MRGRTYPEEVDVYSTGESMKVPSKRRMKYEQAVKLVSERRGSFRDHRRKVLLFTDPDPEPSASKSSSSSLNVYDVDVLIGATGYVSRKQRERLTGWKLKVPPKSESPLAGGLR